MYDFSDWHFKLKKNGVWKDNLQKNDKRSSDIYTGT